MPGINAERLRGVFQLQRAANGPQDGATVRRWFILRGPVGRKFLPSHVQIERHIRRYRLPRTIRVQSSSTRYITVTYIVYIDTCHGVY